MIHAKTASLTATLKELSNDVTKEYDLVVLGGGPGGYVAAIHASQLGMEVAIVEAQSLGGTCLNRGCIPTKILLRAAELYRHASLASEYGIDLTVNKINYEKLINKKESAIKDLNNGIKSLLKSHNIDVYTGYGRILGPSIFSPLPGTISVEYEAGEENTMLVPKYVLIATGSKPRSFPNLPFDGDYIVSSDDLLNMDALPSSIIIVGGGVIGIEWASLLVDLGVDVTIIENEASILITEDGDIQKEMTRQLKKRGVQIYTNTSLDSDSITIKDEKVHLQMTNDDHPNHLQADKMLISIGRESNIADIGLQNTEIDYENGSIKVNDMYATAESHIYAIGDCIGGMQLAHVASEEGKIAVEDMAGKQPWPIKEEYIPANIYSYPEVGKIGLTEEEARQKYKKITVGSFPFKGLGKAHVFGEIDGFMKIITNDETKDILGVHIIGPQATELINEASLAKLLDATAWELSQTVHAHPSLGEIFKETALATERISTYE